MFYQTSSAGYQVAEQSSFQYALQTPRDGSGDLQSSWPGAEMEGLPTAHVPPLVSKPTTPTSIHPTHRLSSSEHPPVVMVANSHPDPPSLHHEYHHPHSHASLQQAQSHASSNAPFSVDFLLQKSVGLHPTQVGYTQPVVHSEEQHPEQPRFPGTDAAYHQASATRHEYLHTQPDIAQSAQENLGQGIGPRGDLTFSAGETEQKVETGDDVAIHLPALGRPYSPPELVLREEESSRCQLPKAPLSSSSSSSSSDSPAFPNAPKPPPSQMDVDDDEEDDDDDERLLQQSSHAGGNFQMGVAPQAPPTSDHDPSPVNDRTALVDTTLKPATTHAQARTSTPHSSSSSSSTSSSSSSSATSSSHDFSHSRQGVIVGATPEAPPSPPPLVPLPVQEPPMLKPPAMKSGYHSGSDNDDVFLPASPSTGRRARVVITASSLPSDTRPMNEKGVAVISSETDMAAGVLGGTDANTVSRPVVSRRGRMAGKILDEEKLRKPLGRG